MKKKLFFILAFTMLTGMLFSQISGPLNISWGYTGTYQMFPSNASNQLFIVNSDVCESTSGGGSSISVTPYGGGHFTVMGWNGSSWTTPAIVTVKPGHAGTGPNSPMRPNETKRQTFLDSFFENCSSFEDYIWVVSGAGATITAGGTGYRWADIKPTTTGTITIKAKAKQNGVWSDYSTNRVTVRW